MFPSAARVAAALVLLVLAGCASPSAVTPPPGGEPAALTLNEIPANEAAITDVSDPLEHFNRAMYAFNARFDEFVFLPAVSGYRAVTTPYVRDRVTSFFRNLGEVTTFANGLLQARLDIASTAFLRFVVNSTLGIGGLYDPMTALGAPRYDEDFGQTLGRWGVGDGPYLVLPLLGPSNLRDATGFATDAGIFFAVTPQEIGRSPVWQATEYVLWPINVRDRTAFRYYGTGSPFEYELVRFLYTQMRQAEIQK